METLNRVRERSRGPEIDFNDEIRNPNTIVGERRRRSEDTEEDHLDCLVRERSDGFGNPDRDEVDGERIGEVKNPSDLGRERSGEMEEPDVVAEGIGNGNNEVRERKSEEVVRERETPPDDDCCAICFEGFTIPCKTNCGHWFCASCILMFWNYSSALQRCKCPICSRLISKLIPEASLSLRREEDVVQVLKKVQGYNRLFVGGAHGFIMKVYQLPLFFRRYFGGLMDPDRFRLNYYTARLIALLLTVFYEICGFDFIPTGALGVRRVFEYSAIALVVILFLVGICHRSMLRRRVRLLAAPPER
ncbi:hypothetical protein CsSME_00048352 [Camellia sinensis var. sinensis]|uniref:E3 ubiquitin-protein ligase RNF170-like isoform X1 n=1 Tax=Camellia sinensis TaxID=4442 RepID=UPI00103559F2|nr:E3 ubiquitin-protein ligase RNF170-like isoform X1 [Camellia sinensis]